MKEPRSRIDSPTVALAVSVVWMLLAQIACVLLWNADLLTRQGALMHWLIVGVLPPALALWRLDAAAAE